VREAGDDVFDCLILHVGLFGGPECLYLLLREKGFHGPEYQKDANSVNRAIALGVIFLVMTNELHLGE
jgi:hypothetical protein